MIELPPPLNNWNIQPPFSEEAFRWQRGVVSEDGTWSPLLTPKGYEYFNSGKRNKLAKGCRKSGKTISVGNRFVRHLWENDGAVGGVLARTLKNGQEGPWKDLTQFIIPGWEYAGALKVLDQGTDPVTKMRWMKIQNAHGGVSELQLHSLDVEADVETKFMSMRFSVLWFSQAEQFDFVDSYRILLMQLRVLGIPREKHEVLFDANPPEVGDEHWLHDIFEKAQHEESKHFRPNYHDEFQAWEFGLDDNPLLDPADAQELKDTYKSDPVKYARFVEGKWVRDTAEGHFDKTFSFNRHAIGNCDHGEREKWEVITPHKNARVLLSGIDLGSLNHAAGFWVSRLDDRGLVCYDKIDEVASIGKPVSVQTFAEVWWKRVLFWTEWMEKTYGIKDIPWRHWADSSLWNFNSGTGQNDVNIFWEVSGRKANLRPVTKGPHSIIQGVEMFNRLFFDNRAFFSAHCKWGIAWARFLKPGKKNQPVSQATMQFKHMFDADRYCVASEIPTELQPQDSPTTAVGVVTT